MAELVKAKQVRAGHRMHTKKLIDKVTEDIMDCPNPLEELAKHLALLVKKQKILEKCDEIVMVLSEIETSPTYADNLIAAMTRLELNIEYIKEKNAAGKNTSFNETKFTPDSEVATTSKNKGSHLKLPKMVLKEYDGSFLKWSCFWDQFDVAVNQDDNLPDIQKFTYLKSFLTGEAERAIQGLSLTKENYKNAVQILKTRFGNKQSRISAHMKELRNLKTVNSINDILSMRSMFDTLEFNINNLKELECDVMTYGSLLIGIIFDRIPDELRFKIALDFGDNECKLDETMKISKNKYTISEFTTPSCKWGKL